MLAATNAVLVLHTTLDTTRGMACLGTALQATLPGRLYNLPG